MTTTTEIRAAIVATIAGVPFVGQVHDRERYAKTEPQLLAHYGNGKDVLGWFVRRVGFRRETISTMRVRIVTQWQIRGYASFIDDRASETAFDALVDAIADAFERDDTLGDRVESIDGDGASGIQQADAGPVMFAGVLCHAVRLSLTTVHHVYPGEDPSTLDDFNQLNVTWGGVWNTTDQIHPNQEAS